MNRKPGKPNKTRFCRYAVLPVLLLFLLQIFQLRCPAADADTASVSAGVRMESGTFEADETFTASFYDSDTDRTFHFSIPYSDAFFERDPDVFYMDLARASFGMTVSAFRTVEDEETPGDQNARTFFEKAGFSNIESDWYDEDPSPGSIASVIASKKVGDATVIAFICCGADYSEEWAGNLTIGSGSEHEGFSGAASICEDRLMDYIEDHEISGEIRLWTSGYSRASAVGNCLAARMIESGLFSDVYGYFFCTPYNTRDPAAYPCLFNIVSQNDAVPQIPFSVWGYGRNGVDLYLPAQESNSGYYEAFSAADGVYTGLMGESFHNNPELNRQLYVIMELVCEIFPTVDEYSEKLQTALLDMMGADGAADLISALEEALSGIDDMTAEQLNGVDALTEYLNMILYEYISGNYTQVSDGSWEEEASLTQNLFFEHMAYVYGSWIFSTEDPAALFEENTRTLHLVIRGDADLEVWDSYGPVQSVSGGNEVEGCTPGSDGRAADGDEVCLWAASYDGRTVISIPADRDFVLKLRPNASGDITLCSDSRTYEGTEDPGEIVLFRAEKDQCIVLSDFFSENGMQICTQSGEKVRVLRQHMPEGIRSLLAREKLANGSYTAEQVLYAASFFLTVPVILLSAVFVSFCRGLRKRRQRPGAAGTVCLCLLVPVAAAGAAVSRMLLPNLPAVTGIYAALAALAAGLLIVRIVRQRKRRKKMLPADT